MHNRWNRKTVEVTSSADSPAISTADMKAFLRVSDSADDAIIASYVASATEYAKNYTRQALLTETLKLTMDRFDGAGSDDAIAALGGGFHNGHYATIAGGDASIELPLGPVQSVTSVTTYNDANASAVFDAASYLVDLRVARVALNDGYTWPTELRDHASVEVVYVAGYGSGSIPEPILQAIRMMVANMYDGCGMVNDSINALLMPYQKQDILGHF